MGAHFFSLKRTEIRAGNIFTFCRQIPAPEPTSKSKGASRAGRSDRCLPACLPASQPATAAATEMNGKVERAALDSGLAPVKTGLYTGTPCQTRRQSARLTCGFLDNIHLPLARYGAISACQLNHVLLRSFRHFLITVSETDSNEISRNCASPLPF